MCVCLTDDENKQVPMAKAKECEKATWFVFREYDYRGLNGQAQVAK